MRSSHASTSRCAARLHCAQTLSDLRPSPGLAWCRYLPLADLVGPFRAWGFRAWAQGVREQGLRKELLRHSATIAPGLARLKKRVGPTAGEGRVSGRNQEKAMTRYLNYRNRWWSKGKAVD